MYAMCVVYSYTNGDEDMRGYEDIRAMSFPYHKRDDKYVSNGTKCLEFVSNRYPAQSKKNKKMKCFFVRQKNENYFLCAARNIFDQYNPENSMCIVITMVMDKFGSINITKYP